MKNKGDIFGILNTHFFLISVVKKRIISSFFLYMYLPFIWFMNPKDVVCKVEHLEPLSNELKTSIGRIGVEQLRDFNENGATSISIRNFDEQTLEKECIKTIRIL